MSQKKHYREWYPEPYLAHHGILGQKWGIRRFQNKDGTLTAAGRKRYGISERQKSKVQDILTNSKYNEDVSGKVFEVTKADKKKLQEAYEVLDKNLKEQKEITKLTDGLFKELENDTGTRNYYEAVSEIANGYLWNGSQYMTLNNIGSYSYMGIFEDGQQGAINAYSMYASKKGIGDKVEDLNVRAFQSQRNAREAASKIVQSALDEVGGENLLAYKTASKTLASQAIVDRIMNSEKFDDWKSTRGRYTLNDAEYAYGFTQEDKKAIKTVEGWASKLHNNKDANTWYLLNEAAENLGMSNMKADEMTQADWDKINAEIRKLRK